MQTFMSKNYKHTKGVPIILVDKSRKPGRKNWLFFLLLLYSILQVSLGKTRGISFMKNLPLIQNTLNDIPVHLSFPEQSETIKLFLTLFLHFKFYCT